MDYNLFINGVYWGYNPLTNHLLTSGDIQVCLDLLGKGGWKFIPKIRVNNGDVSRGRICKTSPAEQIQACPDAPSMVYFPTFTNKKQAFM